MHLSVRTRPSTWIKRCIMIFVTSAYVSAYFNLFLNKMASGRHSRSLCGPGEGRGAKLPLSLSNIQCFGALRRFKCFFGPRGILVAHLISVTICSLIFFICQGTDG